MGWLDKLLGRGKKAAGEMAGESSAKPEGMGQESAPSAGTAPTPEPPAQEEQQPPPGTP
jgi:hypothetical protein